MWETVYLFAVYFMIINNASSYTVLGAVMGNVSNTPIKKTDIDALFAFGLFANLAAWLTIAFSTFRRSRCLVVPTMIFGTCMYIISMSIETHLLLLAGISMTEFWQVPIGWAAAILKVGTCIFVKFWDLNESEDKYSSTGYLGSIPVFQISRGLIYFGNALVLCACRGFVVPYLSPVKTGAIQAFHIVSIITAILCFIVSAFVIMKPQKGLTALFSLLCFGMSIGQAILAFNNYTNLIPLEYPIGTAFDPVFAFQQLEWMTGFGWAGMVCFFFGFVCTLARCD